MLSTMDLSLGLEEHHSLPFGRTLLSVQQWSLRKLSLYLFPGPSER